MEEISRQLLYQRLRNRVIELLECYASLESTAASGAFEMLNLVDDVLPIDFCGSPKVFSEQEQEAIGAFLIRVEIAGEATREDTHDITWFESTEEWRSLSRFARQSLAVFRERGRFSEETEENLTA